MSTMIKQGVAVWVDRWRDLKAFRGLVTDYEVIVRMRHVADYSTGRCSTHKKRIIVTACDDMVDSLATILHEYAHAARVRRADIDYSAHDGEWQRTYAAAVFEVTERRIPDGVPEYALMDRAAYDVMKRWWAESGNEFAWKLLATKGRR